LLFVVLLVFLFFPFNFLANWIRFRIFHGKIRDGLIRPKNALLPFFTFLQGSNVETYAKDLIKRDPNAEFYDFGFDYYGYPIISVVSPEGIKEILSHPETYPKVILPSLRNILGNGIVNLEAEEWRIRRKLLTPGFHFGVLKELIPNMIQEGRIFIDKMSSKSGESIVAKHVYMSVTLRVIIRTAFGGQFDADWMEGRWVAIFSMLAVVFVQRNFFGSLSRYFPWLSAYYTAVDELQEKAKEFIQERRKSASTNQTRADIVGLMLQSDQNINDQDIIDEVKTFLLAGHETTSNLLAWCTYFLCKYPDIQEKLFQEVNEVLKDKDPTEEDLPKLKLVKASLEEALRLRPVAAATTLRTCEEDVTLLGKSFPKDTRFMPYIMAVHWNEKNWKNADQFIPERFLPGSKDERTHPFAFIPFSAGARNCIGQKFAIQEGTIILSMVLQKFRIEMDNKSKCRMISNPTLAPDGLIIKFLPRNE